MLNIKNGLIFALFFFSASFSFAQDDATQLDRILVLKSRESFLGQYSLTGNTLDSLPFHSAVEALSVSFLNLQARSPANSIQDDFTMRGSNFQGVRILLDGQRVNDPQTGHHNADIPLTKEDVEIIEVLCGISPARIGPDAIGGTVNFVTKRPKERSFVLELSGGQHQSSGQLLSISDKINDLGVRFSAENRESGGFYYDTEFKKFTASLASSLDLPLGSLNLDYGYQNKEFGAYDFYTPRKGYPSKEWTETHLINSGLKLKKDGFNIEPSFLWRRHFDKFMLDKTGARSNYLAHHRTDIYNPSFYLSKDGTPLGKLGLGVEYSQEKIVSTTLGKHSRDRESIFFDNAYSFTERLSLDSSLRVDDYNSLDIPVTGGVRLAYQFLENNIAHFGASRAMRIPSFTELYYNDPTTIGNARLAPEKSLTYEIGHNLKNGRFSLSSVFFLRQENNFIDWVKSSPAQTKWEAQNIASSRVLGLEEGFEYQLSEQVKLNANYAYTDRHQDDNGYIYKYGENYARHLASVISFFKFGFGTQEAGITYKKCPARDGWLLMHAKLSLELNKNSTFFLSATNIFNVEYQEIAGIPSPGRWVEGGLKLKW
jgi:iron complex outermembrane receptor protein